MSDLWDFHIETPRLYLSYPNPDNTAHCEFFLSLWKGPHVAGATRGTGLKVPEMDLESARTRLRNEHQKQIDTGFGLYLISLKPPLPSSTVPAGTPFSEVEKDYTKIGVVSMKMRDHPEAANRPDIGFGLDAEWQGQGFATEAARALMKYYEEEKGLTEVFGYTSPVNEASKKALARLGLEERGIMDLKGIIAGQPEAMTASVWALPSMDKDLSVYNLRAGLRNPTG